MHSDNFKNLEKSVNVLKDIYLNNGNFKALPDVKDQELARGFVVFLHAELEQYIETSFKDLAETALRGAADGKFSRVSMSLLTFSGLPPLNGGGKLRIPTASSPALVPVPQGSKKEKTPRQLLSRFGEAHARYVEMLDGNNGVREKYLAGLGIPIGLDAKRVDPNWIKDLESICSSRGAWAHLSRLNDLGKFSEIDPRDLWLTCERLVWGINGVTKPGEIGSFKDLDSWVEEEKNLIGTPLVTDSTWRFKLFYAVTMFWSSWKRRDGKNSLVQES